MTESSSLVPNDPVASETVCRVADGYVLDRWHWEVRLNNGEVVYQDDYRPGLEPMAWRRLKAYCQSRRLFITRLILRFRSHVETPLPDNQMGYLFMHSSLGIAGITPRSRDGITGTLGFCLVGYIDRADGKLRVHCWKVPELLRAQFLEGHLEEIRPVDPNHPAQILMP